MAGKKRTIGERTIIYHGAIAGRSLQVINDQLASVGARELPQSSYDSVVRDYVPYFNADPARLEQAIAHPPMWSQLS